MFTKYNEIFYPYDILLVIDVLLFSTHQDINLVECQLHMLFLRLNNLNRHGLLILMIESPHDLPEGPTT